MVRLLKDDEKMNIISLYEKVFVEDDEAYRQYFYNKVLPVSDVMVYENKKNNEISGMLVMIPKNITIKGHETVCRYIYGVATDPSCRRQGIMDKIMNNALSYLKDDCFTYLIPVSPEVAKIYEKYGFSYVMDKIETGRPVITDENVTVRKAGRHDISLLASFGEKYASERYETYLTKNEAYYDEAFEKTEAENGGIEIYEKDGKIIGYRIGFDDETMELALDEAVNYPRDAKGQPYVMAKILNSEKMYSLNDGGMGNVFINDYV